MSTTSVVDMSQMKDGRSLLQRIRDEAIELYGSGKAVCYEADDKKDMRSVQRKLHTYGNGFGYRMKTRSVGNTLYIFADRELTDSEFVRRYAYRCNKDRR